MAPNQMMQLQWAPRDKYERPGPRLTLALQPADVHVPEELPTYLAGYSNAAFRADEISPPILVDHDSDYYRTFSGDDAFEPAQNVKIGILGKPDFIDPRSSTTLYTVQRRAIASHISAPTERQARPNYNVRQHAARRCQQVILLDREIDVITQVTTATSFATANRKALGAGFNWNGGINSDPIKDLQDRIVASKQEVTAIGMNPVTWFTFFRHPLVRDHIRAYNGDSPLLGAAAQRASAQGLRDIEIPGLPPIKIFSAKYKNSSGNVVYIWPDGTVTLYAQTPGEPTDGESIATFKTFRLNGEAGTGYTAREYMVEETPEPSAVVVVHSADISVITANDAGGIITGAIA